MVKDSVHYFQQAQKRDLDAHEQIQRLNALLVSGSGTDARSCQVQDACKALLCSLNVEPKATQTFRGSFSGALETFNMKPSNSYLRHMSHVITSDEAAMAADWSAVSCAMWQAWCREQGESKNHE